MKTTSQGARSRAACACVGVGVAATALLADQVLFRDAQAMVGRQAGIVHPAILLVLRLLRCIFMLPCLPLIGRAFLRRASGDVSTLFMIVVARAMRWSLLSCLCI